MKNTALFDEFGKDIYRMAERWFDNYYSLDEVDEFNITETIFERLTAEYQISDDEEEDLMDIIAEAVEEQVEILKEQLEIAREWEKDKIHLNYWIEYGVA